MTVFICGDSTAAAYAPERAPIMGWGQLLGAELPGVRVEDRAAGGRSTKSFLAEGRLRDIEAELAPGDLVLIQFTHNDTSDLRWRHTDPFTSFQANLGLYVDTARLRGAVPVLLTPIPRRYWRGGSLVESHGPYPDAIRLVARQRGVPLIDLYAQGMAHLQALGEVESRRLYMHVEPGVFPDYPQGQIDDTHTRREGAETYARMVAQGLRALHLIEEGHGA